MRMEITNMEYRLDAPILLQKVNMICNPKNNATDGKRSKPTWSELTR